MNAVLTTQQKIYRVYQLLHNNNTVKASTLAAQNLYNALNIFVGQITTVGQTSPANSVALDTASDVNLLIFYFERLNLFEEVLKRTSYLGKRKGADGKFLLDTVALTKDDLSIFDPFLKLACANLFTSMQAFSREVNGAYRKRRLKNQIYKVSRWVTEN